MFCIATAVSLPLIKIPRIPVALQDTTASPENNIPCSQSSLPAGSSRDVGVIDEILTNTQQAVVQGEIYAQSPWRTPEPGGGQREWGRPETEFRDVFASRSAGLKRAWGRHGTKPEAISCRWTTRHSSGLGEG